MTSSIGQARVLADGSFELMLRAEGDGVVGDARSVYKPGDAHYDDVRKHLEAAHGPLKPGDSVSVPPWPD